MRSSSCATVQKGFIFLFSLSVEKNTFEISTPLIFQEIKCHRMFLYFTSNLIESVGIELGIPEEQGDKQPCRRNVASSPKSGADFLIKLRDSVPERIDAVLKAVTTNSDLI